MIIVLTPDVTPKIPDIFVTGRLLLSSFTFETFAFL